jgi:hypothetical protein
MFVEFVEDVFLYRLYMRMNEKISQHDLPRLKIRQWPWHLNDSGTLSLFLFKFRIGADARLCGIWYRSL